MVEKIKLSKAAKEIIKNNRLEIKELTSKLEHSKEVIKDKINIIRDLKKDAKDKDMYMKAASVLLAAADERRLMWSLAKEYDRMKLQDELHQDVHKFTKDNLDDIREDILKDKKDNQELELNFDLDKILNDFGLGKNKK